MTTVGGPTLLLVRQPGRRALRGMAQLAMEQVAAPWRPVGRARWACVDDQGEQVATVERLERGETAVFRLVIAGDPTAATEHASLAAAQLALLGRESGGAVGG